MSIRDLQVIDRRIINLFKRIEILSKERERDDETISDLSRLLCILISGLLEKTIVEYIKNYSTCRSCEEIQNYISKQLVGTTNLRIDKIERLLGSFNSEWETQIKGFSKYDDYAASINYIIGNRNTIAHGGSSGVTVKDLDSNYKIISEFLQKIKCFFAVYV